jgi:hypothetical protein
LKPCKVAAKNMVLTMNTLSNIDISF